MCVSVICPTLSWCMFHFLYDMACFLLFPTMTTSPVCIWWGCLLLDALCVDNSNVIRWISFFLCIFCFSLALCFECTPLGSHNDLKIQAKSTSALHSDLSSSSGQKLHHNIQSDAESAFRAYTPSRSSLPSSPDKQQRRYTPTGTGWHLLITPNTAWRITSWGNMHCACIILKCVILIFVKSRWSMFLYCL